MEKNTDKKIYKIKLTPALLVLSIAVLILCGVGIGLSIWRIVRFGIHGINDVIKYPFLIAVCVFCIALVISIYCKTQYVIWGKQFYTQFGFVRTRYEINDVTALIFDRDTNKLSVYFGEEYIVLSVKNDWQESFVRELLNIKPSIDYSFTLSDAPTHLKDDNKKE